MIEIEKIRAEVAKVREEHVRYGATTHCAADYCNYYWPCPTLRLAGDKLKLAEALAKLGDTDPNICGCDDHSDGSSCCVIVEAYCVRCTVERTLHEVTHE
jgi:hypothetical protein